MNEEYLNLQYSITTRRELKKKKEKIVKDKPDELFISANIASFISELIFALFI